VQKAVYNVRLTVLCGIITILVLRGTIGTGMFSRDTEPPPTTIEERPRETVHEVIEEDPPIDETIPFALGLNITDWDETRAEWLRNHPEMTKNKFGKERVFLISGSASKPCKNPVGDHLLVKGLKNKIDYTRLHDIELYYSMAVIDYQMQSFWVKHPMIRKIMLTHPEAEWIWWMDSDAFFTDMTFEVPLDKYKDHNMVLHGFEEKLFVKKSWLGINAGSFLLRNCQWSLDLLDEWTSYGHPRVTKQVGVMLSNELTDRPVFDADDQSVLAYLFVTQKSRWVPKVFLENSYYLHGYWVILVDNYERNMEKFRPGYGDDRWPFVTHFVGCKPCGSEASYGMQRCLQQMERAFNFGDNQILEHYGYNHRALNGTKELGKVRKDSADPLGLGLSTATNLG
jgi:xyloglucan 6-xylosyltransferase